MWKHLLTNLKSLGQKSNVMKMGNPWNAPSLRCLCTWVSGFVAAPASARPLAVFRIGIAAVLLAQAYAYSESLVALYGSLGIVQSPIAELMAPQGVPRISWLVEALTPWGVAEGDCIRGLFLLYVVGLAGLLVGWRTPWMAVVAWLTQLTLKTSGTASAYGVYEFANIALFYCVWMPVGHAFSLDVRRGRVSGEPSSGARLALRVLQLHLCVVYFASGVEKASGTQWWDGEAFWRAVMRPDAGPFDFSWLADVPWIAKLACWGTLLIEIGYAFFVWPRWTRKAWALASVGLHVGIGVILGLWSFSAVMIVFTASAFLISPESLVSDTASEEQKGDIQDAGATNISSGA